MIDVSNVEELFFKRYKETCNLCHSLKTVQPEDGQWGTKVGTKADGSNGSEWTGMVGELSKGRADLCGATLTMTQDRLEAVDFSIGILEDVTSIFMIDPSKSGGYQVSSEVGSYRLDQVT